MKPLSVEQLTLAHFYLREEAKKTLAEMEGDNKDDALDWQDMLEAVEGAIEVLEADDYDY